MSTLTPNNDSTSLAVPKLCDDRSNWANYKPGLQKAMGSRGLWRHVEGVAVVPKPYLITDGIPVLEDKKTTATEEQLELKEAKMIEFKKKEYLAQHIILSTMSVRLDAKIKDLDSAKDMWMKVKADATMKSTLYLIDVEDQLTSMKLQDNDNPKTHFQTMLQHCDNLVQMRSTLVFKSPVQSGFLQDRDRNWLTKCLRHQKTGLD